MDDLVSVLIPAYQADRTLARTLDSARGQTLRSIEIIVVNDGSSDGTRSILETLAGTPRLNVVHVNPNRGKGHAIRVGIRAATGDVIAIQDADLELDPAQLATLVAPILAGRVDVIYGSRFLSGTPNAPRITLIANRALTALTNLLYGSALTDMETCYKIMRTSVAKSLTLSADRFDIEPEITARLLTGGHAIAELPVTFTPRSRAAGKKIGWRDGVTAVRVLLRHRLRS
jgi:glycosyltransferase involved in cell wall biosynthesis